MPAPELLNPIPQQVVNEQAAYGPFDLKEFFKTEDKSPLKFRAELASGEALPKGMICTEDGILTGIPAKGTSGNYEIKLNVKSEGEELTTTFVLMIKPSLATDDTQYFDKLKNQVWSALEQNIPIPDLDELYSRDITLLEMQYLLDRWGILIIWDAFNLEPAGEKVLLELEGVSEHYNVYDRGSCMIAAPKDLYTYKRTILDGLMTAQAMAKEVYKRNWTIEIAGVYRMMRAAWIEMQHLGDQHGKRLEVINYSPNESDLKLYSTQAIEMGMRGTPE